MRHPPQAHQNLDRELPVHMDPRCLSEGKLPPRSTAIAHSLKQMGRSLSLNGEWAFFWAPNPLHRPVGFEIPKFDDELWDSINVPACWETEGFGTPIYSNVRYCFPVDPPFVPERDNPSGWYRTTFDLQDFDVDGRATLRFNGVYSFFRCWLNGAYLGFSKDSKGAAEFDVSTQLRPESNVLAVEVFKWCDGSYLEDQDMFRFGGIFRDVELLFESDSGLQDIAIDAQSDGSISVNPTFFRNDQIYRAQILDRDGRAVAQADDRSGVWSGAVEDPALWNAETPTLYRLEISTIDSKGESLTYAFNFGFRCISWNGGIFSVNGMPVKMVGVNRHEHDPETGRTVSEASMRRDAILMKRHNVNAVRCSHYLNHPAWYEICDEIGLYVIDEANIESHGIGYAWDATLGNQPLWEAAHLDRIGRMVAQHRNHPCVVMWSMGNEAGPGVNFEKGAELIRQADPSRPVHYERDNDVCDVESVMYPTVDFVVEKGRENSEKPFFLCEYAHAMGTACGELADYVEAFESSPRNMGGCVWDWVDQALRKPLHGAMRSLSTNDSAEIPKPWERDWIYAYGGDFDDAPNDGPFSCNGLVGPDRQITPKTRELKKAYEPFKISLTEVGFGEWRAEIHNRHSFLDGADFDWQVELWVDGEKAWLQAVDDITVAPRTSHATHVSIPVEKVGHGVEAQVKMSAHLKSSTSWAEAGHEVAWGAAELKRYEPFTVINGGKPTIVRSLHEIELRSDHFRTTLSLRTGALKELEYARPILASLPGTVVGPRLCVERAFVDNDQWFHADFWNAALSPLTGIPLSIDVREDHDSVVVQSAIAMVNHRGTGYLHEASSTFWEDGTIRIRNVATPRGDLAPHGRMGLRMFLSGDLSTMQWFGNGPGESYPDRKSAQRIGRWRSNVDDEFVETMRPQDFGSKQDVRWLAMTDKGGRGVFLQSDVGMAISASRFTAADLDNSRHKNGQPARHLRLSPRKDIVLNLDHVQMGLGGASCGPRPKPEFILQPGVFEWTTIIRPWRPGIERERLE